MDELLKGLLVQNGNDAAVAQKLKDSPRLEMAGLLAGLEMGLLPGQGSRWRVVDFKPGDSPLRNLARRHALARIASTPGIGEGGARHSEFRCAFVQNLTTENELRIVADLEMSDSTLLALINTQKAAIGYFVMSFFLLDHVTNRL